MGRGRGRMGKAGEAGASGKGSHKQPPEVAKPPPAGLAGEGRWESFCSLV